MRWLTVWAGMVFLCLGCAQGPGDSKPPGKKVPAQDAKAAISVIDERAPVPADRPGGGATDAAAGKRLGPEELEVVVNALTLALGSEQDAVTVAAADALRVIGPPAKAAAPALAGKLDHVQGWVRCAAMDALTAIGPDAVPALVDTFRGGPGNAPIRAAIVLGSIGPDAKQAIAALEKGMQDMPNRKDRLAQIVALIDPTHPSAAKPDSLPPGKQPPVVTVAEAPIVAAAETGDWPQFHGPRRDALCGETGLLKQWPQAGPELLWEMHGLGIGYSTVSIAGGRLFTMGDRPDGETADAEGTDAEQEHSQFVLAFDLKTRRELWATRIGGPHDDGPRCTPTIDGPLLYGIGTDGNLMCLETETGTVRWQKSLPEDFGGRMMSGWKYCESPLVDGDRLLCTPGGPERTMVALDKQTGESIWEMALPKMGPRGKDGAGYSSMVAAEIDGVRQYVQLLGRGVVGVEAQTGRFLWGYNRIANNVANITSPVVRGNLVFVTTSYNTGSALLQVVRRGDQFTAEEVYFLPARQFANHHGGVVLVGGHIYGGSGQNRGAPTCLDLATGEIAWQERPLARGSAAVLYADGQVIFRYDRGLVALVEAKPDGFQLDGTFQALSGTGPAWAHPVIHDGKLYLRHNDRLLCYDVKP